jgi:acylphosphatase
MGNPASLRATIHGHVQGVFFRESTRRRAQELGLTGYVRNMPDHSVVEVVAEGEREKLETLLEFLRKGPPAARVDSVDTVWSEQTHEYSDFGPRY